MTKILSRLRRSALSHAALAGAALALAACSGPDPAGKTAASAAAPTNERLAETARLQFAKFEAAGTPQGRVLSAIHSSDPGLYDKLVDIAAKPGSGEAKDVMDVARPLYLSAFARRLPFASDADINEFVDIQIETHKALAPANPLLCAQAEKADMKKVGEIAPPGLIDREFLLEARVIETADPAIKRATQAELDAWKARAFKGDEPRLQGNQYFEISDPTPTQAAKICDAELFILEAMAKEKPERRAYLYRGLMAPR